MRKFLVWLFVEKGETASPSTAAYCKARQRLEQKAIDEIHQQLVKKSQAEDLWYGRAVKVVDGSSISMPDTPENQKAYPQPKGQKPGCGFPVMRIVVMFLLAGGTILDLAQGALSMHERDLFRKLWHLFDPGDVALTDRGFCSYADMYYLTLRGVDCVMRKNQGRKKGLKVIKRLGKNDRIVQWEKTHACPTWLTREQWQAMPDTITLREITVTVDVPGIRSDQIVIVTTLLDPGAFPRKAFADLYCRRWNAELYLRDIKTTMGMDILRCKTPEMVVKEMWMHVIGYNLVRAMMIEAAVKYNVPLDRISYKGTVSTVRQWSPATATPDLDEGLRREIYQKMLYYIAKDKLPYRPNRVEPRAQKRRPKSYQYLTKPRESFEEIPHRERYKKA